MQQRRGPSAPPGAAVKVRVESLPKEVGSTANVRFLGPVFGTYTHYHRHGSVPCLGDDGECASALHKTRKVWKGFAAAEWWRIKPHFDWCPCVWEVTEALWEVLEGITLRGTEWKLSRVIGELGRAEVTGVATREVPAEELHSAFDPFPHVHRVYKYVPMLWDVKCHIPRHKLVIPAKGTPPAGATPEQAGVTEVAAERSPEEQEKLRAALDMGRKALGLDARGDRMKSVNGTGKAVLQ